MFLYLRKTKQEKNDATSRKEKENPHTAFDIMYTLCGFQTNPPLLVSLLTYSAVFANEQFSSIVEHEHKHILCVEGNNSQCIEEYDKIFYCQFIQPSG